MSVVTNIEVPDSLYSLSDEEVSCIFEESTKRQLSKEHILSIVEKRYPNQRRVAKSIAGRVKEEDLTSIHEEIIKTVGNAEEVKALDYCRDRTCVTLVCE